MVDILKREKEFQKLNEELDKKTKSIIEKSSTITPSTNIKLSKNKNVKNTELNNEFSEKNKFKQRSISKASTIPKRFRDSLTNRKIKENKISSEVNDKSVQISEDEFSNESGRNGLNIVENTLISTDLHNEPTNEEESHNSYSDHKEDIKQNLPKANTVPKRLRDTLTNRKSKESNFTELKKKLLQSEIVSLNEIRNDDYNTEPKNDLLMIENEEHQKTYLNSTSTASTLLKIKQSCSSLRSTKSNETDSLSSRGAFKKSYSTSDSQLGKKNLSHDGLVKYLKSKISILEVELSNSNNEIIKQTKELEMCYETQLKFESQRDQAISKNNVLTEQVEKLNEKLNNFETKFKDRETEFSSGKREVESLKREIKVLNQTNKNLEKRLYRANEEIESSKSSLDTVKKNERSNLDIARIEKEKLEKQIKDLKRQRNEFLNAYKKQLFLIDNLKRQNICMEQYQIIGCGEKQFSKILDINK